MSNGDPLEGPFKGFVVGNSLTNDGRHEVDYLRAADMGVSLKTDHYINGNFSLVLIVDDPTSVQNSAGFWPVALPAIARDWFAFQPWPTTQNTMLTESTAFMTLVDAALDSPSINPKFYVYQTWPSQVSFGSDFAGYWAQSVIDADSTYVISKRQFFTHFYNRILAQLPNTFLIPVGEVLAEFDRLAKLGQVPDGVDDVFELYRGDAQHLGDAGRFIAASTRMAVILQRPPTSLNTRVLYRQGNLGTPLTDAMADFIEELVWEIVSNDPRTGVTP